MTMMLRRAMMGKSGPLYPMPVINESSTSRDITATPEGHVSITLKRYFSDSIRRVILAPEYSIVSSASGYDAQPVWFHLPAGAVCRLEVNNILDNGGTRIEVLQLNLRTDGSKNVFETSLSLLGETSVSKEVTLPEARDVKCLFSFQQPSGSSSATDHTVSFDVRFIVNGIRYI